MYFVQQQTTTQNHITIFGMIIMEFKMEKNELRYVRSLSPRDMKFFFGLVSNM